MTSIALLLALALPAQETPAPSNSVIISVGSTTRLQMSNKRPITSVTVDRDNVVRIRPVRDDQTTILVTGVAPGRALITLTDDRGQTEMHQLGK